MKELLTIASMLAVSLSAAAESQFILDIDDASHVKFETGAYAAVYQEVELQNGPNTITVSGSEDFVLTPNAGYLIESITAYDENGVVDENGRKWSFDSSDDSYKVYFLGSLTPPYRYEVKTKVNDVQMKYLTVTIDNPEAVLKGSYKVGNQTVASQEGSQTIEYNPAKGVEFYMQLRPAVAEVVFLRNGISTEPAGVMKDGTRTYKFNLAGDHETIDISTIMEERFCWLDIDDPAHVDVFYPDMDTPVENLVEGRNRIDFDYDKTLYIAAKDGYRIQGLANMEMNKNTDVYSYKFGDGDSGVVFNCTTEEYVKPTCTFIVNVDNPEYVSTANGLDIERIPGENLMKEGDNVCELNLDKVSSVTLTYSYKFDDKLIGSYNGEAFVIDGPVNYWDSSSSTFKDFEAGETYRVVVRQRIEGDYKETGTVVFSNSADYSEWTVNFDPAGVIELLDGVELPSITQSDAKDEVSAYAGESKDEPEIELGENDVVIRFSKALGDGDYRLTIPDGLFKVNNAFVGALAHDFSVIGSGIGTIDSDSVENVKYFTLQGVEVSKPQSGQMLIVKRTNGVFKEIVK